MEQSFHYLISCQMGSIQDSRILGSGVDIKMKPGRLTELELLNWRIEVEGESGIEKVFK